MEQMAQTTWTITVLTNEGGEWQVQWNNSKGQLVGKTAWCQSSNAAFIQMGEKQSQWLYDRIVETTAAQTATT